MSKTRKAAAKEPLQLNRLAVILKEERKTNRWLAEEIGFSEITISKWATNTKQPALYVFYQIALVLRRDLKDFFPSTTEIPESTRTAHLKRLEKMVEQAKRTGK